MSRFKEYFETVKKINVDEIYQNSLTKFKSAWKEAHKLATDDQSDADPINAAEIVYDEIINDLDVELNEKQRNDLMEKIIAGLI